MKKQNERSASVSEEVPRSPEREEFYVGAQRSDMQYEGAHQCELQHNDEKSRNVKLATLRQKRIASSLAHVSMSLGKTVDLTQKSRKK